MVDRLSRDGTSGGEDGPRTGSRLLTVDDVRAAISCVSRGEFGGGPERVRDSDAPSGASAADGDPTSSSLLDAWACGVVDADRLRAVQEARLAAFVLTRVLDRPEGADVLDEFLEARDSLDREEKWGAGGPARPGDPRKAPSGTSFGAGSFDDPRISTLARSLLSPEDAIVLAAKLRTRLETARKVAARAIVAFVGLHDLLKSAAEGRLPFERVDRLHFRVDDALLSLSQVQMLDEYLDGLDEKLSMDQFEKHARMRIRTLAPAERHPDAARKNRCVRIERRDDDTAILEMVGPIVVIEALYQRLRAMARAIMRHEIGALGLTADGRQLKAKDLVGRVLDDRRMAEMIFDLLAGARPQTQLRVGRPGFERSSDSATGSVTGSVTGSATDSATGSATDGDTDSDTVEGDDLPEGTLIDVLCPTDGDWLRKQAAVTITVPASSILSLDDAPGRINGDTPLSAEYCRDAAAHATSWTRVLTDPATSIVTDHVAHTYEPTAAMRRTIRQKWRTCTAPGCSRPSVECEIEHCCRFSKRKPESGGLTVMENLHVMCKHHHELKTRGIIRLTRLRRNEVAWALPMGVEAVTSAPPLRTGIDPPDPQQLLSRAEELDRSRVSDEPNGPDLFTSVGTEDPDGPPDSEDDPPPF